MNVLRRYLITTILRNVAVVLLVLLVVGTFIQFVGELDDVGVANYGLGTALGYVLLGMPQTVLLAMPAAALLGALLGLGNLAVHHELVVMRSSGISNLQLVLTVGLAGFALSVVMALLGGSLSPSLGAYAREMRAQALLEDGGLADAQSTWLKDGNLILNLRRSATDFAFGRGVYLFELDDSRSLKNVAHADSADVDPDESWVLSNYRESRFSDQGVAAGWQSVAVRRYNLNSELLGLSEVRYDLLDTPVLQRYIAYLQANNLDADGYLIAYWSRISRTVSALFMTLLAMPFVFGSMRSAATGARLVVGLVIGLGFYALDETVINSGTVFELDPLIVAWAPTLALALVTSFALSRLR